MSRQIATWTGVQNSPPGTPVYVEGYKNIITLVAAGSITAGDWVAFNIASTTLPEDVNQVIQAGVVSGGNPAAIGVALQTVSSGKLVEIQVGGYVAACNVVTGVAAGDPLIIGGTDAGRAETVVAGDLAPVRAVALAASALNVGPVWIFSAF